MSDEKPAIPTTVLRYEELARHWGVDVESAKARVRKALKAETPGWRRILGNRANEPARIELPVDALGEPRRKDREEAEDEPPAPALAVAIADIAKTLADMRTADAEAHRQAIEALETRHAAQLTALQDELRAARTSAEEERRRMLEAYERLVAESRRSWWDRLFFRQG